MSAFKKICKQIDDHSFLFFMSLAITLSLLTGFIFRTFNINDIGADIIALVLIVCIAMEIPCFCQHYNAAIEIMKENPSMKFKEAWKSVPEEDDDDDDYI